LTATASASMHFIVAVRSV